MRTIILHMYRYIEGSELMRDLLNYLDPTKLNLAYLLLEYINDDIIMITI